MRRMRWILALVFCFVLFPGRAEALLGPEFEITGSTLTKYNGTAAEVTIPDGISYIDGSAFIRNTTLKKVTIPGSVQMIGKYAFAHCTNLTEAVLGNGIGEIREGAFQDCGSLARIDLPNSVKTLGDSVFRDCTSLARAVLPAGITSIPASTFSGCTGLSQIVIPEGVFSIGKQAFSQCTALRTAELPRSLQTIGESAFQNCTALTGVTLPDMLSTLGQGAFAGCTGLREIAVPENTTILQKNVFNGCTGLSRVTLGSRVTNIGEAAFKGCIRLSSIDLPDSLTHIGRYAFSGSGLISVRLPDGVESLGDCVFDHCSLLEEADLGSGSFSTIESSTLSTGDKLGMHGPKEGPSILKVVRIPASVNTIKQLAFAECDQLTDVYFGGTREQWVAVKIEAKGNEALSRANVHFAKPPQEMWWPGTPTGCGWRWNPNNQRLSVLGFSFYDNDQILAACYDSRDRMLSARQLISPASSVPLAAGTKTVKLFYLTYNSPHYPACVIDAASLT